MPRLSDTMTEGVVSRWLKGLGDPVAKGEPVVEVETEKATLELVSEADGFLVEIKAAEGVEAPIGSVIGRVGPDASEAGEAPPPSTPTPERVDAPEAAEPAGGGPAMPDRTPDGRLRASPVARRLAAEFGIELDAVGAGRGPQGRILRSDVERAARGQEAARSESRSSPRRHVAMARRMVAAKQEIPHFYLSVDADVTRLEALRRELREEREGQLPSLTSFVVRACARALRAVPEVNSTWRHDVLTIHDRVNVGIAVALDDGGLVVPVVADADARSLFEIDAESRRLAERARGLGIQDADLRDGTFTVSSMGMLGVDAVFAIVNPPQSGILSVGRVRQHLALVDGAVEERDVVFLGLSGDHRAYTGATGAKFLGEVRRRLESPLGLLLAPA